MLLTPYSQFAVLFILAIQNALYTAFVGLVSLCFKCIGDVEFVIDGIAVRDILK